MKALLSFLLLLSPAIAHGGHGHRHANQTIYASHYSGKVYTLQFDPNSGRLSEAQSLKTCGKKPSWLTIDHESNTLYCLDEAEGDEPGHLFAYSIKADGTLEETAHVDTLPGPVHAAIYGQNKKFIATANSRASAFQIFSLPLDDSTQPLEVRFEDPNSEPYGVYVDPIKQSSLFILDKGIDMIHVYTIAGIDGHLEGCESLDLSNDFQPEGRIGVRRAAFTKTGDDQGRLHLIGDISNSMYLYDLSYTSTGGGRPLLPLNQDTAEKPKSCPSLAAGNGSVHWRDFTPVTSYDVGTSYPAEIKATGDRDLYTSYCGDGHFGSDDSILEICEAKSGQVSCGYRREEEKLKSTGQDILFSRKVSPSYGQCPRSFDVNPHGSLLAFANRISSTVAIVPRKPKSYGALGNLITEIQIGAKGNPHQRDGLSSVVWGKEVGA